MQVDIEDEVIITCSTLGYLKFDLTDRLFYCMSDTRNEFIHPILLLEDTQVIKNDSSVTTSNSIVIDDPLNTTRNVTLRYLNSPFMRKSSMFRIFNGMTERVVTIIFDGCLLDDLSDTLVLYPGENISFVKIRDTSLRTV